MNLSEKNVVYVGGFGGIGFQACRALLKKNVNVSGYFFFRKLIEKLLRSYFKILELNNMQPHGKC